MTHGEEPGPETHQDSAVLTYLEGLLMHPVGTGPGAIATRRTEAGNSNEEQSNKAACGLQLSNHNTSPKEKSSSLSTGTLHLKKARLLRSGAWSQSDAHGQNVPGADLNGQQHKTGLDGSPQGESTLLASLLQSFSSRLQSVALSQHVTQSNKQLDAGSCEGAPLDQDSFQGYGTASSRLKGLMRKSKLQNHNSNMPYRQRSGQESLQSSTSTSQPSAPHASPEAVSCAERLKAVANLVKNRSSPAPSPKPSMACSQLALLLSSEAHLQQYSREQALKAQLSSRSASERLAAMATQQSQDTRSPSMGEPLTGPDTLSPLNPPNGTLPQPAKRSPSRLPAQARAASSPCAGPQSPKGKRPLDKQCSRPPQNCSSLLLLLLNNHNSPKELTRNGHLEEGRVLPSRASSLQSDSENSLTKYSSDAESSYSGCSPIDLSVRSRVSSQESVPSSSSSLDKLTESLINKWKPDTPGPKVSEARELEFSPDVKSHHKVTLMQLLLDRRNGEKVNKTSDNPDLQRDPTLRNGPAAEPRQRIGACEESRTPSQLDVRTRSTPSPYAQASPLDLSKLRSFPGEAVAEPAFSASKLLQNLAHCGLQNARASPPLRARRPPKKRQSPELDGSLSSPPQARPGAPLPRIRTPGLDPAHAGVASPGKEAPSEIENLLERRTILQLLLGTSTHKDNPSGRRSTDAAASGVEMPSRASVSSNGSSLNLNVKTEPAEESFPFSGPDDGMRCWKWGGFEKYSPRPEPQDHVKTEPCPTEDVAKYGLLSQLLKQQTTAHHSSAPVDHDGSSAVKEEPPDYRGPVPKKRRLCQELAEHLSSELCPRAADPGVCSPDRLGGKRVQSPKEDNSLVPSPASRALSRDSQGFNVLKQLLLSDNCLKDLSQVRPPSSPHGPQANGNFTSQPGFNHNLAKLPWHPLSVALGTSSAHSLSAPPGAVGIRVSPWEVSQSQPNSTVLVKDCGNPVKSESAAGEKGDSSPDSPRLTRSNPILYYMLQRGNGQLRKELRGHGEAAHFGVNVKEDLSADKCGLRPAQRLLGPNVKEHNGSLEK
ncbi:nuclear receptor-interacting protein 1 [Denticeps clupeoides]|uniref:Nuclear receptor-interacting protein 1 n=1 Tax=Denticeps clupeoides TaxID=299321 RepID=A0AAY4D4C3_9TELE|nr:nuclear receptor-interacting protein 1-like [Denticeps clupeoides]